MAIQDDFVINPDTKVIRHDATKSTIYSAVSFYSFLQDTFDEPGFLSYEIPIRFNTPTSFTMLNGWFLDDGDGSNILQYITSGGIDTLGYATVDDPIIMIDLDDGGAQFVPGDLDLPVTQDATPIGPLLSYKDNYPTPTTARAWIRDTNTGSTTIVPGEALDVTGGTGDYVSNGYSEIGDNIYHNLFTIAAFPGSPDPQVYVYQNHPVSGDRTRISEWSAFTNWDRSSVGIDVLITTQLGGNLIDGGNITSFVRQTGDGFTFVESTLTTSGRTPIATETSADEVNITEGEHYLLYNASGTGAFSEGDVITDVPINPTPDDTNVTPPSWYAEVVAVEEFLGEADGLLTLRGLRGTIVDDNPIFVGTTQEALANGVPGDTVFNHLGGTQPTTYVANTITGTSTGAKRLIVGIEVDEKYVGKVDDTITGDSRDAYYKDFTTADTINGSVDGAFTVSGTTNTLISGFTDVTVAHINGTCTYSGGGATGFTAGERVTWAQNGGGEAIFILDDGSSVITLGNVQNPDSLSGATMLGDIAGSESIDSNLTDAATTEFNFPLQSFTGDPVAQYAVYIEGGDLYQAGRSLTDVYAYLQFYLRDGQSTTIYTSDGSSIDEIAAEEYIKARSGYNASKVAPFGTLAGGVFFGAQAVWIAGMAAADDNNVALTDAGGTARNPFTSVLVTVSNTRKDDRIAIYLEAGTTELPNKIQYTSHATLNTPIGRGFFDQNAAGGGFPNDTPTGAGDTGTFIVVDNALNKQHRYRYSSFVNTGGGGDDGIFTLTTEITGLTDGVTADQTLEDDGFDFKAAGVLVGDIIHRTDNSLGFCYVTATSVTRDDGDDDVIQTTLLEDTGGTAATGWTAGDNYAIYSLVKIYDGSDTFFIPYLDVVETAGTDGVPGSAIVTLTFVEDRDVILEVRNVQASVEIVPFKTTGQILETGYTQGVIRNEDTVTT